MCLFPLGGGGFQSTLVPPNDKARLLCDHYRLALLLHLSLTMLLFISSSWIDAIFDCLALIVGYMAVRSPEGYNYSSVVCYCIYCGFDAFWSILRLILFYASSRAESVPVPSWQYSIYVGCIIAAPIVYIIVSRTAYHLYKELQNILNETITQMENNYAGGGVGGGYNNNYYGNAYAPSSSSTAAAAAAANQPPSSSRSFGSGSVGSSRQPATINNIGSSAPPSSSWQFNAQHPVNAPVPPSAASSSSTAAAAAPSSSTASSFKAFSGQGHRLGGR